MDVNERPVNNRKGRARRAVKDSFRALNGRPESVRGLLQHIRASFRLVRAWLRGEYPMPWRRPLFWLAIAALYFICPLDLLPDWIPFAGWLDDAAVLALVLRAVRQELERFIAWERN